MENKVLRSSVAKKITEILEFPAYLGVWSCAGSCVMRSFRLYCSPTLPTKGRCSGGNCFMYSSTWEVCSYYFQLLQSYILNCRGGDVWLSFTMCVHPLLISTSILVTICFGANEIFLI